MKRRTVITDRLGCAVAGAGLLGLGLAAIGWSRGDLGGSTLSIGWLATAQTAPWWPLALGAVAILLIALGLAWLVAHRPGQSPGPVALPGSSVAGSFTVDLSTAAEAAAASLAAEPSVESASGRCRFDRGQRVIEIDVKIDPRSDLSALSPALESTCSDLATALDGVPFASRILLRTARRRRATARVG